VKFKRLAAGLAAVVTVSAASVAFLQLTGGDGRDRFDDRELSFEYPSEWERATWPVRSSFEILVTYLSTEPLHDPVRGRRPRSRAASRSDAFVTAAYSSSGRALASRSRIATD